MMSLSPEVELIIENVLFRYESDIKGMDEKAMSQDERCYPGFVRSKKGKIVEDIAKDLTRAAWITLGGSAAALSFNPKPRKLGIPIRIEYVNNIKDDGLRNEILAHIKKYKMNVGTDLHVNIDGKFVLSIECKSYTEMAMFKRIMFDAYLLQREMKDLCFALIQFESMLGGDYSELPVNPKGSFPAHTVMSYMDSVDLHIITLIEGQRHVKRPIHKAEFYKPMEKPAVVNAIRTLAKLLPHPTR